MVRPLAGILVLDLTQMASGPFATMMLADAGATVVKIEHPRGGDPSRSLPPFTFDDHGNSVAAGILRFGRNKRSLALNLATAAGQAVFLELVLQADVVWENFVGGTMERFGLGYERLREVNPRLVYAALSGFGRFGSAEIDRTALDIVAQAESGLMDVTGEPDGPPGFVGAVIGDLVPALFGVIGTLEALMLRSVTGEGTIVDVAMVDSLVALNERAIVAESISGSAIVRGRLGHAGPYGRFDASDGFVVIGASIPSLWTRLCRAIEREDLLEHAPAASDDGVWWRFGDLIRPEVAQWAATRTCDEILQTLRQHAVPAARVATVADMVASDHVRDRRMLLDGSHPVAGKFRVAGSPIKLGGVAEPDTRPAPLLGEHTDEVLRELLGYDDERLRALRDAGAIA